VTNIVAPTFVHYLFSDFTCKVCFPCSFLHCLCGSRCWASLERWDQLLLHTSFSVLPPCGGRIVCVVDLALQTD